ncbi:hypothetical protein JCM5350_005411 [Sporobolomyces pararoseus]
MSQHRGKSSIRDCIDGCFRVGNRGQNDGDDLPPVVLSRPTSPVAIRRLPSEAPVELRNMQRHPSISTIGSHGWQHCPDSPRIVSPVGTVRQPPSSMASRLSRVPPRETPNGQPPRRNRSSGFVEDPPFPESGYRAFDPSAATSIPRRSSRGDLTRARQERPASELFLGATSGPLDSQPHPHILHDPSESESESESNPYTRSHHLNNPYAGPGGPPAKVRYS